MDNYFTRRRTDPDAAAQKVRGQIMDWAKSKSILIFVFLALNIFLIIDLGVSNFGNSTSRESILSTKKILENKGVVLTCEIPVSNSEVAKLNYENKGIDRSQIVQVLLGDKSLLYDTDKENIELTSGSKTLKFKGVNNFNYNNLKPAEKIDVSKRSSVEKRLKEFIISLGLPVSGYYTDEYKENTDGTKSITFRNKYKNLVFFDNYETFIVSNEGILSLDCSYRTIKELANKKTQIMSAYEILLKNFNVKKNMVITGIDLGWYIGYKNETDIKGASSQTAWRIFTKEGEKFYFNAYTGEKMN